MGTNKNTAEAEGNGWTTWGNCDAWELLCKAIGPTGEYHSTKILRLKDGGCLVQCDTRTPEGQFVRSTTYAPALPC